MTVIAVVVVIGFLIGGNAYWKRQLANKSAKVNIKVGSHELKQLSTALLVNKQMPDWRSEEELAKDELESDGTDEAPAGEQVDGAEMPIEDMPTISTPISNNGYIPREEQREQIKQEVHNQSRPMRPTQPPKPSDRPSHGVNDSGKTDNQPPDLEIPITTPSKPELPKEPEKPITPEVPEVPNEPELPETPEKPGKPEEPENPENPEKPTIPETPEKPETPEQPEVSEKPDAPEIPNDAEESSDQEKTQQDHDK